MPACTTFAQLSAVHPTRSTSVRRRSTCLSGSGSKWVSGASVPVAAGHGHGSPDSGQPVLQRLSASTVAELVSRIYTPLVDATPKRPLLDSELAEPATDPREFLHAIVRRCPGLSPAAPLVAVLLIERVCQRNPAVEVTCLNRLRLLLVAMIIAAKVIDDETYTNEAFARLSGYLSLEHVNQLELQFIQLLDYEVNVTPEQWSAFCARHHLSSAMEAAPLRRPATSEFARRLRC